MRTMFLTVLASLAIGTPLRAQEIVYHPGQDGVGDPVLTREVKPNYTEDAKRRQVQGTVELSVVVRADGSVGDTRITKSLDADLDQQAIKAVKQWQFKPATKSGKPVNVQVSIELTFTLAENGPVYKSGDEGVTMPVATKTVNPAYDDGARQDRVQGVVGLEAVVEPSGQLSGIRVVKPLDERLDRHAVVALQQWQFKPGQRNGVPVRVRVYVEMSFTLK